MRITDDHVAALDQAIAHPESEPGASLIAAYDFLPRGLQREFTYELARRYIALLRATSGQKTAKPLA